MTFPGRPTGRFRSAAVALAALAAVCAAGPPALAQDERAGEAADPIKNPIAVFSGLDKITTRIIEFDVYMNETVQFGALRVTPRACHTRPPTEEPNTVAFVEIDEITLDSRIRRIFTGWMFAASPGLNAVDHPVYDVLLVDCAAASDVPPPPGFDPSLYREEGLGLVFRPDDWQPVPRPKPPVAGAGEAFEAPDVIED